VLVVILGGAIQRVEAQEHHPETVPDGWLHTLRAADYDAHTVVPPPVRFGKRGDVATARITVTFNNFPEEAERAFRLAADLWETHVESPVPIRIRASWEPLGEGVLGSAGPALFANFQSAPERGTWYAAALADALAGSELGNGGEPDIFAFFNSDFANWYFRDDLDGGTPSGLFDFTTVVFHEIGHGLGFTGSFTVDDGDPEFDECPGDEAGVGCWGEPTGDGRLFPIIFDRFTEDASEVSLLNQAVYPNPSVALADILQGEAVFFDGENVRAVNEDVPVDLYAPDNFELGSSFSHLDEQRFPPGTPNSLMTPFLARAETIFSPGPVTCAIFRDIGWPLGPDCLGEFGSGLVTFSARADGGSAVLQWTAVGTEDIARFIVEQRFFDGPFVPIDSVQATGTNSQDFTFRLTDLAPGRYTFRLIPVRVDGTRSLGPQQSVFIPLDRPYVLSEVYPNPVQQDAQLTLQVSTTQRVRAVLYDVQGRELAELASGIVQARGLLRLHIDAGPLGSGIYFVRVLGDDFAETRSAVVVK
jgi:hypothetical protein